MSASLPHPWHGGPAPRGRPVVVGTVPGRGSWVVREAGELAAAMGVGLLCVWADPTRVLVGERPDGTLETTPLDPDEDDQEAPPRGESELADRLARDLADVDAVWRLVYTVGEAAHALAAVAERYDARLIAVGPRRPGWAGWMSRLAGGSIAGRLAQAQHRPVLVVPPPRGGHR